ncbi:MAG: CAP domain-containing protein [Leptolyngbyaceae cyanobacterium]
MFRSSVAVLLTTGLCLSTAVEAQSVAMPGESHQPDAIAKNEVSDLTQRQTQLLRLMNEARQERGLSPLRFSNTLQRAAQAHVEDIVSRNFELSHTGSDGSSVADRVRRENYAYRSVGENVAAGYSSAEDTFEQWMNSRGHRENILNPDFSEVGMGYRISAPSTTYNHYWVLVLGRPAR